MGYFVKNRRLQSGSTGVVIPTGSAAERPDAPVFGMIRYNTDSGLVEFYNGTIWQTMSAGGSISYTVDNFTGDGSTDTFTMSIAESNEEQIIVFVGSIYQDPATAYTVDGGLDITFTSAPPNTVPISVIHSTT
jgi:stress response protein SCP2